MGLLFPVRGVETHLATPMHALRGKALFDVVEAAASGNILSITRNRKGQKRGR